MDTRERILDSAQRLIQTRSFHGFCFQDIANEVGIRKPSVFHYFDSKDELAVAVLQHAADWVVAQLQEADALDPAARLQRYFDMFGTIHGKGERMCPLGSFGALFDAISPPVQRALHQHTKWHFDWLESVVRDGVAQGQFAIGDQRPHDVALQIFASVQGALLTGRLATDPHVIEQIGAALRRYLGCADAQARASDGPRASARPRKPAH